LVLLLSLQQVLVYGTCRRPSLRSMPGVMTVHRQAHGPQRQGFGFQVMKMMSSRGIVRK
jgi:hypothetical protein